MLGHFLKELRENRNVSQSELADFLGCSRQTIAQVEKGDRELTISEAQFLADFFSMSLHDFLNRELTILPGVLLEKDDNDSSQEDCVVRDNTPQITVDSSRVEKFKQVLLYLLSKVGAKPNVGETVLYKLLYFIDFDYYEKYEEQLIGATYMKNHFGPTPVEFGEIVAEMRQKKEITLVRNSFFQKKQKKYLPVAQPDLSVLSAQEIKHIDQIIDKHSDKNATEISDYSHLDVPWITAEKGKVIDYESVFYRTAATSVREYA